MTEKDKNLNSVVTQFAEVIKARQTNEVTAPESTQAERTSEEQFVLQGKSLDERLAEHYKFVTRRSQQSTAGFEQWRQGKAYEWLLGDMLRSEEYILRDVLSYQHEPGRYVGGADGPFAQSLFPLLIRSGRVGECVIKSAGDSRKGLMLDGYSGI